MKKNQDTLFGGKNKKNPSLRAGINSLNNYNDIFKLQVKK